MELRTERLWNNECRGFCRKCSALQIPGLEMGLFILVLFGMELILSVWTIRRQKKQSLIEQMRAME